MVNNGNTHVLPDSRLASRADFGCVMADWELPGGGTIRLEMMPIYCANCGKHYGYVPKENCTFACWMCNECVAKYGLIANTYAMPDDEFNRAVAFEVQERYGKDMTELELFKEIEQGRIGTALEKLERESPYILPSR